MSFVVGTVNFMVGEVRVISTTGVERLLQVGEAVLNDDRLILSSGAEVELSLLDGDSLALSGAQSWIADQELSAVQLSALEASGDAPAVGEASELTALQQAILEGADPTAVAEATAAGQPGAGEAAADAGGSSFVALDRTGGEVNPSAGYPTGTFTQALEEPQNEALATPTGITIPLPQEPEEPVDPDPVIPPQVSIIFELSDDGERNSLSGGSANAVSVNVSIVDPQGQVVASYQGVAVDASGNWSIDISALQFSEEVVYTASARSVSASGQLSSPAIDVDSFDLIPTVSVTLDISDDGTVTTLTGGSFNAQYVNVTLEGVDAKGNQTVQTFNNLPVDAEGNWEVTGFDVQAGVIYTATAIAYEADGDPSFPAYSTDGYGENIPPVITAVLGQLEFGEGGTVTYRTAVSEEGIKDSSDNLLGLPDDQGTPDTTNFAIYSGIIHYNAGTASSLQLVLTAEGMAEASLTSGGTALEWRVVGEGAELQGYLPATTSQPEIRVITVTLESTTPSIGESSLGYTVTLSGPIDHPLASVEDVLDLDFQLVLTSPDFSNYSSIDYGYVSVEDDSPFAAGEVVDIDQWGSVSGNLLTNDAWGADSPTVEKVHSVMGYALPESGELLVRGDYGLLRINATGEYSYSHFPTQSVVISPLSPSGAELLAYKVAAHGKASEAALRAADPFNYDTAGQLTSLDLNAPASGAIGTHSGNAEKTGWGVVPMQSSASSTLDFGEWMVVRLADPVQDASFRLTLGEYNAHQTEPTELLWYAFDSQGGLLAQGDFSGIAANANGTYSSSEFNVNGEVSYVALTTTDTTGQGVTLAELSFTHSPQGIDEFDYSIADVDGDVSVATLSINSLNFSAAELAFEDEGLFNLLWSASLEGGDDALVGFDPEQGDMLSFADVLSSADELELQAADNDGVFRINLVDSSGVDPVVVQSLDLLEFDYAEGLLESLIDNGNIDVG